MGVPGFFLWLWKKYRKQNFVFSKDDETHPCYEIVKRIDELLIDANCLMHPQCFKVLDLYPDLKDVDKLERKMISQILDYLDYLIQYVQPQKCVYIAIDGVAPFAKIQQQRTRRFKSSKDRRMYDSIKKKHKKEIKEHVWSNAAITPGTEFMEKAKKAIIKHFDECDLEIDIIFSSSNVPSEGEHKLLQHIRDRKNDHSYAIYGLDADLLFLALATMRKDVYLVREAQEMGQVVKDQDDKEVLNYVAIDIMRECVYQEFQFDDDVPAPDLDAVIYDFIFICYFLGNDFLPHIPSLDIQCREKGLENGLDQIIRVYRDTYINTMENMIMVKKDGANTKIILNELFIQIFLENLSIYENEFFIKNFKRKRRFWKCQSDDPYDQEVHRIDNIQFRFEDPIELGKDSEEFWKFRYYKEYFHCERNQEKVIEDACHHYYRGLLWVAYYYFDKCPSWTWSYPYKHAPFISDLSNYFKGYPINEVTFEKGKPLKPFIQLLSVLPPQYSYLLPHSYSWLMRNDNSPIIDIYPQDFELDILYKRKYWQAIPFLPDIDVLEIEKAASRCKLNKDEKERNKVEEPIWFVLE